jgi:hypothetical protein
MRRSLLPLALTGLGLWLLIGCIYIPGRDKVEPGEHDPRPHVGRRNSDRPLRVAAATRADVHALLGLPNAVSGDGRSWVYKWNARNGSWAMPLCFTSEPAWRHYSLRLDFGDDGRLKRFDVDHDVRDVQILHVSAPPKPDVVSPATTRPSSNLFTP